MNVPPHLPRILVVDDLFGRVVSEGGNAERRSICAQYLLKDVTEGENSTSAVKVKQPLAEAVFYRGQTPAHATVGDTVRNDLQGALELVRSGSQVEDDPSIPWSLILLDLCFYTGRVTPESNNSAAGMAEGSSQDDDPTTYFGLTLLSEITSHFPGLPIAILSNQSRDEVSREFSSRGALAFLPRAGENSREAFREVLWKYGLVPDPRGRILGSSLALLQALRNARQAGQSGSNILVRGERGTGKELLATYIHEESRSSRPYVVVDSGALSQSLYASELFGHRRGSFTGADSNRTGKIALADGGDLFLDEIGNMPVDVQAGLLRVLEQREVMPLGASLGLKIDVRFLSATNEDLEARRADGLFRDDLYDRLCRGGTVMLPALRDRPSDIPLLAQSFLADADSRISITRPHHIEPTSMRMLQNYAWPGNIRELETVISAAATRYADVEHLFPTHFALSSEAPKSFPSSRQVTTPPPKQNGGPKKWPTLLQMLRELTVDELSTGEISSTYHQLEEGLHRSRAMLLRAALEATRRRTPDCPEGEILLHPAVKLLLGTKDISASRAADLIKRILAASDEYPEVVQNDAVLTEALERAMRLRPTKGSKSRESR